MATRRRSGASLADYGVEPRLDAEGAVAWAPRPRESGDGSVLRGADHPFQPTGRLARP